MEFKFRNLFFFADVGTLHEVGRRTAGSTFDKQVLLMADGYDAQSGRMVGFLSHGLLTNDNGLLTNDNGLLTNNNGFTLMNIDSSAHRLRGVTLTAERVPGSIG